MILWSAFCSVNPLYLFPASDLPLTSGNLLKFLSHVGTEAKVLLAVPLVFKLLGDSEEGLAAMRKFRFCNYGGSSLPDELGDRLVVAGVNLTGGLGSTEVGSVASSMRDFKTDKGWNYYRLCV
jgi:long-subunit acyl-CoA synthetase (AMP-forming)